jgi:hypothetical protein
MKDPDVIVSVSTVRASTTLPLFAAGQSDDLSMDCIYGVDNPIHSYDADERNTPDVAADDPLVSD